MCCTASRKRRLQPANTTSKLRPLATRLLSRKGARNEHRDQIHAPPVGGNVFADLGFEQEEAAALKDESQRIISEKRAIKDALMAELAGWIEANKLKQAQAAEILGVTRPRVSDVINKKTSNSPLTHWWTCWHGEASTFSYLFSNPLAQLLLPVTSNFHAD